MPKFITDPANPDYSFGKGFNYSAWEPGTDVTLLNVPWNNDYRDVVDFPLEDGTTLDQWIDAIPSDDKVLIPNISYLKFNIPLRLNIPFNSVFMFNYIRVNNPLQPIPGTDVLKSYYYFILQVNYIAPNTTELIIQLDAFQSFAGDFTLGNCYVERGHIGIANTNGFNNNGRDYLTVPEGIDYGGEYRTIYRDGYQLMKVAGYNIEADDLNSTVAGSDNFGSTCGVLGVSTTDLNASPGDVTSPNLVTAKGNVFEGIPSGADIWYWPNVNNFLQFMAQNQDTPWVTQGILSVTIIPNLRRYDALGMFDSAALQSTFFQGDARLGGEIWNIQGFVPKPVITPIFENWRDSDDIINSIPEEYRILKKFFTYPYMVIEMTNFTGKAIPLKPESWTDPDATVVEIATFTAPNQRVVFYPSRYNALPESNIDNYGGYNADYEWYYHNPDTGDHDSLPTSWENGGDDGGEFLDVTTMIDNFPTIALVNNGALGYLASNFANIAYQQQSAAWTQQRALQGNQTSYDQNNKAIQTSKNINALQNAGLGSQTAQQNLTLAQQQQLNGVGRDITSLGAAATGVSNGNIGLSGVVTSVGDQVMGAIGLGIQQNQNNASTAITQNISRNSNLAQNNQAGYVNDTNKSLADWSAKGDYANTIAGINAMVQGASMIQPTTSGQQGGDTFNLVTGNVKMSLRWKLIDLSAMKTVGNYWLRYGYAVQQFIPFPDSFKVMTKFTYWKLQESYINSAKMPEGFKQIIRGIFEKGVTVWSDPSFIGNTALSDNQPLEGISF